MNKDDLQYLFLFYISIVAGYIDRKIEKRKHKQVYGATVGVIFAYVLCGQEIVYPLLNILVNTSIIINGEKKKCHLQSFIFTFSFLYISRIYSLSSFTNILLMSTTLRMVGVACEVNSDYLKDTEEEVKTQQPKKLDKITFSDIALYGMNYIGLLGAPYYTYSVFEDYLNLPFRRYHDWKNLCFYKLICSTAIMSLYVIVENLWPLSYVATEEFHSTKTILYRIWYVYPTAYSFIFRVWNAFVLFDCCCCMTGLGVYPRFTKPKCGYGPTVRIDEMISLKNEDDLKKQIYSFSTIKNVNIMMFHTTLGFGEAIKQWNTTIQYWLYTFIYKKVHIEFLKKPATMFVSSYWHGLHFGYFASLFFSTVILFVDKRWQLLLDGKKSFNIQLLMQMAKFHLLYNCTISFLLKERDIILQYQKSTYYNSMIIFIFFSVLLIIVKRRKV
ncbi:hypothetical protein HHI36_015799 [Cryptolaemus montrouzieri]|uniref:Lysophospholipid acyltransferase 7 n=1 Tax=Cryptolaemus montrouzieri TaxID=559131 RepID=A0ABD2N860_9CUCU